MAGSRPALESDIDRKSGHVVTVIFTDVLGEISRVLVVLFFFQAEDGIRDYKVTGVQTCALPIWEGKFVNVKCWRGRRAVIVAGPVHIEPTPSYEVRRVALGCIRQWGAVETETARDRKSVV